MNLGLIITKFNSYFYAIKCVGVITNMTTKQRNIKKKKKNKKNITKLKLKSYVENFQMC